MEAIAELTCCEDHTLNGTFSGHELALKLARAVGIFAKAFDQTDLKVFRGEEPPATGKNVSFLEEHTNIIEKGRRDDEYGHKVFLSGGESTIIFGYRIVQNDSADSAQFRPTTVCSKDALTCAWAGGGGGEGL